MVLNDSSYQHLDAWGLPETLCIHKASYSNLQTRYVTQ